VRPSTAPRAGSAFALAVLLAAACSSGPPVPDWQQEAHAALQRATQAQLAGDSRVAQAEHARARRALSSTARADRVALAELTRCAGELATLASLDSPGAGAAACPAFEPLRADAGPAAAAYADFLGGPVDATRVALLPAAQQAAAAAGADGPRREAAVRAIADPLSRLVAAGAALRDGAATPGLVALAVETASAQGWRRALLAWLTVQRKLAEAAGDAEAAAAIRRRIELAGPPPSAPSGVR
jgi:hypothetical protein